MNGKTILAVDDDKRILKTVKTMLESEGYSVLMFDSARKALKKITGGLKPDAIILDIGMPDMTGLAFLKEISDENGRPRFPVVVLTARPNLDEFFANLEVSAFIAKPCTQADLVSALQKAIGASSAAAQQSVPSSNSAPAGKKKVLLVEDDHLVQTRLAKALAASDYVVMEVDKGSEVLDAASAYQPDVVVLNKILTGTTGDRIAQQLVELPLAKDTPVVMYEDNADPESARRSLLRSPNVHEFVTSTQSTRITRAVRSVVRP